jgi:hypothetical protein
VDGVAEATAAVMQHGTAVHSVVSALCSGTSSSSILLKDASSLLRTLLMSPQISASLKVTVLHSVLACTAAHADAGRPTAAESSNAERSIMAISILHMFFVDALQPLPHDRSVEVAALATDSLKTIIRNNYARDARQMSHAASQTLQLQVTAVLLVCLPVPSKDQNSKPSQSSLLSSTTWSSSPPSTSPHCAHVAPSSPVTSPLIFHVTCDGFVTSITKATSAMLQQGGQQLLAKEYLFLVHRIAINLPASASSAACDLEHSIPDLFVCISKGDSHVQRCAIMCLSAMFEREGVFPNAVRSFLKLDGLNRIFQVMKTITANFTSSSHCLSPSSWTSSDSDNFNVLSEGTAMFITYLILHLTPHTSHLTPHTSHLTPHTSHLTPHTSLMTCATSHVVLDLGLILLGMAEKFDAVEEDSRVRGMLWNEEGTLELLTTMLNIASAGRAAKAWERDDLKCENVVAAAAVKYLSRISRSSSSAPFEPLLYLLLPLLLPDTVSPSIQIEISDAMAEIAGLTLMLQNPDVVSQIVMAARSTTDRDVKKSLVMLLSRLFFNCPPVQQEIMRLKALPLLHEISAIFTPSSPSSSSSSSSSQSASNLLSQLSRSRAHELHAALHQRDSVAVNGNQVDSASTSHRRFIQLPLHDPVASCFSSAWLSPLNGSIWRLDSDMLSEQMMTIAAVITDYQSARAFCQSCGCGVGFLRPLTEHGHHLHQPSFVAVMSALYNAVRHIQIRRNRLAILSLFPDGHWHGVVTSMLSMVAMHPPCAVQVRLVIECLCGDSHGQLGLSAELLQLKAFELQATFEGVGKWAGGVDDANSAEAASKFPADGSCMNFSQEGLRFAQALAQMMMSDMCADLLEAGRPENVQLLRAYLALEHEHVLLKDWLGLSNPIP